MNNNSWKKSPYLLLVIGIFAVSTAAILIKTVLPSASPISVAFHRLFFSAIIANLILFSTKREEKVHFDFRLLGLLVLSGVLLALHFALWIWSLDLVSVNSSVIFVTTSPLWVGILSPIVLKERVPRRFYIGLLFAFLVLIAVLGNNAGPIHCRGCSALLLLDGCHRKKSSNGMSTDLRQYCLFRAAWFWDLPVYRKRAIYPQICLIFTAIPKCPHQ